MGRTLKDAVLKKTVALPNGASSVTSSAIDLETTPRGDVVADFEVKVSAPALATADLGNGATMKYDIVGSNSSDLSGPTTLFKECITQTGASTQGAIAAEFVGRLSIDAPRYIGVKATNSASGDASDKSATIELVF